MQSGSMSCMPCPGMKAWAFIGKPPKARRNGSKCEPMKPLEAACAHLRERGFQLVAAHIGDEAKDYRALDYTRPTALVLGTELFGVSEAALAEADQRVKIPMMGVTRSLNVSVACAIVLYEAMRQRQAAGMYTHNRLDDALLRKQRFEWLHPKVAEFCRQRGLEYPAMDEQGNVVGEFPRGE